MKTWKLFILTAFVASGLGCGPKIPLIGMDDQGNLQTQDVPMQEYSQKLGTVLTSVERSTLPALEAIPEKNPHWALRTVVVGLGISGEGGLGPITFGASSRLRLAFTNSTEPPLP